MQAAIEYVEKHRFSVIPIIPGDKKPLIKWEEFQRRRPTRAELVSWWGSTPDANIGIVTGEVSNLFVVDLDKYASDYDEEKAREIIPDSVITPVAVTPRGGQHLYFNNPAGANYSIKARILPGIDYRGNGGFVVAPPSENGNGRKYAWVDGLGIDVPRSDLPIEFVNLLNTACLNISINNINNINNSIIYKGTTSQLLQNTTYTTNYYTEGRRDEDLFHAANALIKGGAEHPFVEKTLELLALACTPPFPCEDAKEKIRSAMKRAERRERNLAQEIREFLLLQEGYINTTEILQTLQITTKEEKKNATVILSRLAKEGVIRKYGNKRGCYEPVIKQEDNIIDIFSVDTKPIPLKLPLDVHDLVKILPKNIIVLAGEVNAGKSAYLLNLAAMNMRKMETVYFSSEMGGAELRERLQNFDFPVENWREVTFIDKASDFASSIRPDGLNIVDFLELHDEFFKVGMLIKDIFDRLKTGVAVIAIQKNKGRDEGLGGQRSLEKARLYMALEQGRLKIVKAKNWMNPQINPNGMFMEFRLAKGCYFKGIGPWRREEAI